MWFILRSPTLIHYHMGHSSLLFLSVTSLSNSEKPGFYNPLSTYLFVQLQYTRIVVCLRVNVYTPVGNYVPI